MLAASLAAVSENPNPSWGLSYSLLVGGLESFNPIQWLQLQRYPSRLTEVLMVGCILGVRVDVSWRPQRVTKIVEIASRFTSIHMRLAKRGKASLSGNFEP
jgi:hypothetical protein